MKRVMMRRLPVLFSFLTLLAVACTSKEEAQEPDYDNMVMADQEETPISDEERDRKVIAGDLPVPQELLILEPSTIPNETPSEIYR